MSSSEEDEDLAILPPPDLSDEPGSSGTKANKRSHVSVVDQPSCCAVCSGVLKDPVSSSCGHWICRQCITSHRDQPALPQDSSCPLCGKRSNTRPGMDFVLQKVLEEHKNSLKRRCECVMGETDVTRSGTLFINTELYITEGLSEEVNTQHEIWQLETAAKTETHGTPVTCHDIFKVLPGQQRCVRVILTTGVGGAGKTFSAHRFTLEWAKDLENQDVSLLILLSFWELNLIKDEQYSLLMLLRVFHPALHKLTAEQLAFCKLLFILDGLDESRLSLEFENSEVVSDPTQMSSVNMLLTNLIKGNLLPSALVWITSRPAAANQIPPSCVDRIAEVQGFTDAQKEEYFKRKCSDRDISSKIISYIKTSRILHIMCRIPVLCWITATVVEQILITDQSMVLPKTLTDLYVHFLLVQAKIKDLKFDESHEGMPLQLMRADREVLLKLGKLAFEHLGGGTSIFYEEDLEEHGLDVTGALKDSAVCTEIFKRKPVIFQKTVYYFVHESIQEFLAAVYAVGCYRNAEVQKAFLSDDDSFMVDDDSSIVDDDSSIDDDDSFITDDNGDEGDDEGDDHDRSNRLGPSLDVFLTRVMDKSLESENGHLDVFVRFIHGLLSNSLLRILLIHIDSSPEIIKKIIRNLKKMNIDEISPDRSINIFPCLMEMNDRLIYQEVQTFLKLDNISKIKLNELHCSALAYLLLLSDEVLDDLDLSKYRTSSMGKQRLIPAVRNCRKARLCGCELSTIHCKTVASALKSNPSHLRELDMSTNYVETSGAKLLSAGLESPHCRLETLRLDHCEITGIGCAFLASALKSNPSHLRELDLSNNKLRDSAVKLIVCDFLESPNCRLEILRLSFCGLSEFSCIYLGSAPDSCPHRLRELDLSKNRLYDSGLRELCYFLESPRCRLEILRLSACRLTHERCSSLASAMKSRTSHLRELDLSRNKLKDLGVKLLCVGLKSPHCRLETLRLQSCELSETSCASLASAMECSTSRLKELDLSDNKLQDSGVKLLSDLVRSPHCRLETLRLSSAKGPHRTLTEGQKVSDLEKEDRSESPGSSCDQIQHRFAAFSDEPGPSNTMCELSLYYGFNHPPYPSTSNTNLDVSEAGREEDVKQQQHQQACADVLISNDKTSFTPELLTHSGKAAYRFRCPGPGVFRCTSTELVFVMAQEAELLYRTVQWDERLLLSAQKVPAGLLFDIKCSKDDSVCQLHLPHCEIMDASLSEGLLSVVHITDDGMNILQPLEITETHVVVRVSHFSALGIVKSFFKWLLKKPVKGQVLLYLGQPNPKTQRWKLNVFLLPRNIHLDEVSTQQRHAENIEAPSACKLITDQSYTLHCPQAIKIQPKKADFDLDFGPNYHPTFEIRLPTNTEEVTVTVKDHGLQVIWEHDVDLTDSRRNSLRRDVLTEVPVPAEDLVPAEVPVPAEERLLSARREFVQRVSEPVLSNLLDKLLERGVISDNEMQSVKSKVTPEKARDVIDTVRRKGSHASSALIAAVRKVDPYLSKVLNFS